uniref:Protein arginine methyltransferase NDUFAF7 n=1 Tax=Mucochytrium quahogii TaxID=96639 RepID=A0A7S2WE38_9STRA|mmetsp:Transcript_2110/g.4284  ORF Transcript_2110/g.4284 Transcript_2110/m.4284 type:complete len:450 (+) Transcript_2110:43-1392(+)
MLIGRNLRLGPRVAAGGLSCRCRVSRPAHVVWRGLSGRSRDADERMFPGMSGVVGNDQEEIARRGDKILNSVGEAIGGQDSSTWQSFSVDRSGLIGQGGVDELKNKVGEVEDELDDDVNVRFSERTPLVDEIALRIKTRGPISVAEFMSLALTHPVHGYYMRRDVFNEQGDFSTAPEISNLFGELIGLWCVSNWIALGRPRRSHLVEMGPGKGTLMSDALNVFKKYPSFLNSLQLGGGITMLERSSALRVIQQSTLGCVPKSGPKPNYDEEIEALDRGSEPGLLTDMPKRKNSEPVAEYWRTRKSMMTPVGDSNLLPTRWVDDIEDLMDINKTEIQKGTRLKNTAVFVVAQELFDALPIHQFEYTKARAWRERLVDLEPRAHQVKSDSLPVTDDANTKSCTDESLQERHHFRFVLARNETPASSWLARDSQQSKADVGDKCEIGGMGGE